LGKKKEPIQSQFCDSVFSNKDDIKRITGIAQRARKNKKNKLTKKSLILAQDER
jgi:hypothetical protein